MGAISVSIRGPYSSVPSAYSSTCGRVGLPRGGPACGGGGESTGRLGSLGPSGGWPLVLGIAHAMVVLHNSGERTCLCVEYGDTCQPNSPSGCSKPVRNCSCSRALAPQAMTQAVASRIQSAEARSNGGKVDSGSFAARAQDAAARNAAPKQWMTGEAGVPCSPP